MLSNSILPKDAQLVFSNSEIVSALNTLADKLNQKLENETPVVLCVMQGGLVFSGQLIPKLTCMLEIDYIHATRYNNGTGGGQLQWRAYPVVDLSNRTILILDDILDEGITLQSIIQYCETQGATKIISAVLLRKKHDRCVAENITQNYALTVEDDYVFGFGMDYNGQYRQLDAIYKLKQTLTK